MTAVRAGVVALAAVAVLPLLLIGLLAGGTATASPATGPVSIDGLPAPVPFTGPGGDCTEPDPTTNGCLTPTTLHVLDEIYRTFGIPGPNAPIRAASCWDRHAWNPSSDHPRGRACDLFPGKAGVFAAGTELRNGWTMATWLRANVGPLRIKYLIWQGRFWEPGRPDRGGWGVPYTGGGVYDPTDATGGHYDHIHVSIEK
ncbi:hypothetical protein [Pseudonocardia sp. 73-21]|uniref:hypothetical protein n=1 Tax=Pseudonocardia sp. 73-21 TaxID=1895809 RepID=UPI00096887A0|nr:hypothetical protein [Pseudonocardia sp. 73-21]OJY41595.1 MAG: hypothetical protein BGP03_20580 [Pseudonocardia sp. 73-21]